MKTHITHEQFEELDRRRQVSWSLFCPPPEFYPPGYFDLPDIGCMIEYLDDHGLLSMIRFYAQVADQVY